MRSSELSSVVSSSDLLSEDATYLMADQGTGREGILRVHRVDYHDRASIESELDWLTALGKEAGVSTPRVIHTTDGDRVVSLEVEGHDRHAVLFEVVPGIEPDEVGLAKARFEPPGAITAPLDRNRVG